MGLGWYHGGPAVEADGVLWGGSSVRSCRGTQRRERWLPSGVSGDPGQVVYSLPDPLWVPRSRLAAVGCS